MAEIKGLINAKGKGGSGGTTKIFLADADYITITQDDLGSWSFPTSEIADIEFLTPESEDYPTESDFADGDLLYVYSEEVVEEDGEPVEIKKEIQAIYEIRYIENNSVVLQKRLLIPQSSGGGGSTQLYKHDIKLSGTLNSNNSLLFATIINDSPLPFVKSADYVDGTNIDLMAWLRTNGYTYTVDALYGTIINKLVTANCSLNGYYGLLVKDTTENYLYCAYQLGVSQWTGTTLTDNVVTI